MHIEDDWVNIKSENLQIIIIIWGYWSQPFGSLLNKQIMLLEENSPEEILLGKTLLPKKYWKSS